MGYFKLNKTHQLYIDLNDKTISFMDVYNCSDSTIKYKQINEWFEDIQRTLLYSIQDNKFFYKSVVDDKCTILPITIEQLKFLFDYKLYGGYNLFQYICDGLNYITYEYISQNTTTANTVFSMIPTQPKKELTKHNVSSTKNKDDKRQ